MKNFTFTFVDQSVTNLNKVRRYVSTGLDHTLTGADTGVENALESSGAIAEALMEEMGSSL